MRRLLLIIALALGASAAHSDDDLFYVGAGVSRNQMSDITNNGLTYSDIDKTSWKLLAGIRPISFVGAEADYMNFGGESSTFFGARYAHSDSKAFAAYGVGFLPVPVPYLDLFVKAGLARWELQGSSNYPNSSLFYFSTNGTSFAWGAGAQVHLGMIGARLEYEKFNVANTGGAGIVSLDAVLILP
jgi:OOP family OmpA-OmpF porin